MILVLVAAEKSSVNVVTGDVSSLKISKGHFFGWAPLSTIDHDRRHRHLQRITMIMRIISRMVRSKIMTMMILNIHHDRSSSFIKPGNVTGSCTGSRRQSAAQKFASQPEHKFWESITLVSNLNFNRGWTVVAPAGSPTWACSEDLQPCRSSRTN